MPKQNNTTSFTDRLTLDVGLGSVHLLQTRDDESSSLASAVLCTGQHVSACQNDWNRFFLDGRGLFEALFKNSHEQLSLQIIALKLMALGGSDILANTPQIRSPEKSCRHDGTYRSLYSGVLRRSNTSFLPISGFGGSPCGSGGPRGGGTSVGRRKLTHSLDYTKHNNRSMNSVSKTKSSPNPNTKPKSSRHRDSTQLKQQRRRECRVGASATSS
jgi:hypothetical protein